jgi:hypothetical protein
MKLTTDDYRRHYRDLCDEELLAVSREDLVEAAQKAYDEEIAQRKLTPLPPKVPEKVTFAPAAVKPEPEPDFDIPPEVPEIPANEPMVQVAVLMTIGDTKYALQTLWKACIPARVAEEPKNAGRYAEEAFGLLVPESSAEAARNILAGYLTWNNQILVRTWLEKDWEPDDMDLSDFEVAVDDQFGEDYKVAVRLTVTGVDPHTRKKVKLSGIGIVHVDDGSIGEHWIRL